MAISGIPEVINDFNVYLSGNKLIGLTGEVALPEFEGMTETISGPGILGEFESTVTGRYSSMEQEIPFRILSVDIFKMIDTTTPVELTLRGAQQYTVASTGAQDEMGMRIVFRGRCKKLTPGTVKQGGTMDSSITLELTYILIEVDGTKKVELDKINGVFKLNGVDKLAKVRKYT
ncbi:MAG: phage major tail tube protein [Lachnospiraceae bacterium]|nr:phage major tail tube protein [Clostridiales bacterium]MCD8330336.1 phage major tail tube protein [Lachnospiraceae bacterium]